MKTGLDYNYSHIVKYPCQIGNDSVSDRGETITPYRLSKITKIDRRTVVDIIKRYKNIKAYKSDGRWVLRIKDADKVVMLYRYSKSSTLTDRNGRVWSIEEIEQLKSNKTHKELTTILKRSYQSIKTKRCKMGLICKKLK